MKKTKKLVGKQEKGVIPLKDLAPRGDPKGGRGQPGGQAVFGAGTGIPERGSATTGKEKRPRKR